jgi:hypothetical protein
MNLLRVAARVAANLCAEEERSGDPTEHTSIIRKTPDKEEWCVRSEKNPDWSGGCYPSKAQAEQRLKNVEMFKHIKNGSTLEYLMSGLEYVTRRSTPPTAEHLRELWSVIRQASRELRATEVAQCAGFRLGMLSWILQAPIDQVVSAAQKLECKVGEEQQWSGLIPISKGDVKISVVGDNIEEETYLFAPEDIRRPGDNLDEVRAMVEAIGAEIGVNVEENASLPAIPEMKHKELPRTPEGIIDETALPKAASTHKRIPNW